MVFCIACVHTPKQRPFIFHITIYAPADTDYEKDVAFAIETFAEHGIEVRVDAEHELQSIVLDRKMQSKLQPRYPRQSIPVYYVDTIVLREDGSVSEGSAMNIVEIMNAMPM